MLAMSFSYQWTCSNLPHTRRVDAYGNEVPHCCVLLQIPATSITKPGAGTLWAILIGYRQRISTLKPLE